MADPRRSFNNRQQIEIPGSAPAVFRHSGSAARYRSRAVEVANGKSGLVFLDAAAIADANDPSFVRVWSSIEGVQIWPIDSADPGVDADTAPFGYILDLSAPTYEHDHGVRSSSYLDGSGKGIHAPAGAKPNPTFYAELPCWWSNAFDRTIPTTDLNNNTHMFSDLVARQHNGDHGGVLRSLPPPTGTGAGSPQNKNARYLIGMNPWLNLGTGGDGLQLRIPIYVGDNTIVNVVRVQFGCYPFSAALLTLGEVPDLNPDGYAAVWSPQDNELDCINTVYDSLTPISGTVQQIGAGYRSGTPSPTNPSVDGWVSYEWTKSQFGAQVDNGFNAGAQPAWNRITNVVVNCSAPTDTPDPQSEVFIGNIWFGPPAGLVKTLRPHAYLSAKFWSATSKPAIGVQNLTGQDAIIRAEYGAGDSA